MRIGNLIVICLTIAIAGCQQAAEKRIRAAFDIDQKTRISEEVIATDVQRQLPIGSTKEVVIERLSELEEGPLLGMSDPIVGIYTNDNDNKIVVRFEYGNSLHLVKEHYAVEFQFSDNNLLTDVIPHVWLTGL